MAGLGDVGVVIVSHRSAATLEATLSALPFVELAAVIVVDNASPDRSADIAREAGALVIEQANLGFGAGNNRGNAELSCELVLFLNPDARISRSSLQGLVQYLDDHPRCAVVGPLVSHGGRPTYSAGRLTSLAAEIRPLLPDPLSRLGPHRRFPPTYRISGPVGYVEGACFLVRRSVLAAVGGFDEGYFLYAEELELAQRLRLLGQEVHLCSTAEVEHVMGASTSAAPIGAEAHKVASMVRYYRRWHGEPAAKVWVRLARASWALRVRSGALGAEHARALKAAATGALRHPPPPPVAL